MILLTELIEILEKYEKGIIRKYQGTSTFTEDKFAFLSSSGDFLAN